MPIAVKLIFDLVILGLGILSLYVGIKELSNGLKGLLPVIVGALFILGSGYFLAVDFLIK